MNDNDEKIPPFVQDYLNKMEHEAYADFVKLSREYHKEREEYPGKYATQSKHLNDFNRATGQNRQLNYEDGLKGIDTRYKQRAFQLAKQHGFTGPDPNQPSDKELTKQGEKLQAMIDKVRKSREELQQKQKQDAEKGPEPKKVETLKKQETYKQNPAFIDFKGVQQERPSGEEQSNQDHQRAAFLEQIKINREKQTQQRKNDQGINLQ